MHIWNYERTNTFKPGHKLRIYASPFQKLKDYFKSQMTS